VIRVRVGIRVGIGIGIAATLLLGLLPGLLSAHPLAPALLRLSETGRDADGLRYEASWQIARTRLRGSELQPRWPADCQAEARGPLTPISAQALAQRWQLQCPGPLSGRTLGVDGLEGAGLTVILRVERGSAHWQGLLDAGTPALQIPALISQAVFPRYLRLGVEHLLLGPDHLLFVLGLFGLVRGLRARLITLTAFTLGHSLTLALAALDRIAVPPALAEFGIALSLVCLALALLKPAGAPPSGFARHPAAWAIGFGLLHGLGFAGALQGIGLPAGEILPALFAFNLGIELGQVGVVLTLAAVTALWPRLQAPGPARRAAWAAGYAVGSLGVYAALDRSLGIWLGA
jgi:hypothetical protein